MLTAPPPITVIDSTTPPDSVGQQMELTTIELLHVIRRRRGINTAKAARRWKLNVNSLRAWEAGKRYPRKATETRLKQIIRDEERRGF